MHSRKCRKCSNFLSSFQLIGMSECQTRIKQLVDDAKQMAGLPQDTTLEGLVSVPTGRTFPGFTFVFCRMNAPDVLVLLLQHVAEHGQRVMGPAVFFFLSCVRV